MTQPEANPSALPLKLEIVVIPVSDVDREFERKGGGICFRLRHGVFSL